MREIHRKGVERGEKLSTLEQKSREMQVDDMYIHVYTFVKNPVKWSDPVCTVQTFNSLFLALVLAVCL